MSERALSTEIQEEYLVDHIPYRLIAVDGFKWFLEKLIAGNALTHFSIRVDGITVDCPSLTLTNALVDAGLAHGRALCEFLGVVRRRNEDTLQRSNRKLKRKGDDFWVTDLGLREVTPKAASSIGPEEPEAIRQALVYFLRTASKGVAHLTIGSPPTDLQKLHLACRVIRRLVEKHVYVPLENMRLVDQKHHPCAVNEAVSRALGHCSEPDDWS